MDNLLRITLIGLLSGMVGTGIGGLAVFFVRGINNRFISVVLEFSGGLMTAVVCFQLVPEAFELGGGMYALAGITGGVLSVLMMEEFVSNLNFIKKKGSGSSLLRAGILMTVGISLHNFPEGIAVGAGFESSLKLGILLTIVILLHDIPEGMAMAIPMRAGGFSRIKAFSFTILSGVPMGMGALAGGILGDMSKTFIGVCLGFAAGAMLYIVNAELLVESKKLHKGRLPSIGNVVGIICGILITWYG